MIHSMLYRRVLILVTFLSFLNSYAFAQNQNTEESDQQIDDFSLAGYGEKGKKTWDISGKSADIFTDVVKLKNVVGNLYGKEEDIKLTAEKGDFNKTEGKVHLQENVVITTSSGTRLTTNSLDWDRKNQLVTTEDLVNIERQNMLTTAYGVRGEPNLKEVSLKNDVTVNINPAQDEKGDEPDSAKKIVITCAGPLQINYAENIATFNNDVKVDTQDVLITSDIMDVYFGGSGKDTAELQSAAAMGSKIEKIIAQGNVKITRGENISYSDKATYTASDKKIILSGRPKLIIYSTEDMNASLGN